MIRPLSSGYHEEIDTVHGIAWHEHISRFSDTNIYQVWQLGDDRHRARDVSKFLLRKDVSTLLLKKDDAIVAAAEVRLFLGPFTTNGVAFVRWGPLWQRAGRAADPDHFRQAIRALHNEYVQRRGMVLRIKPRLFAEDYASCARILADEGVSLLANRITEKSLVIDLSPTLDELRAGFDRKWRNCLNKAQRSGLTIAMGTSIDLFDRFTGLYVEMLERKQFGPTADIDRHRGLQAALPEEAKMWIVIAHHGSVPCAGAVCSTMGETALYLFGATNEIGMRTSGSYLVQWELLKLLKQKGIRAYDLHGINNQSNPGTYHFKKGLAGKHGREVTFVGQSQAFRPSIANYTLLLADRLRWRMRTSGVPGWGPPAPILLTK